MQHFYVDHILRMPQDQWPDPVLRAFAKINKKIYIPMQGPSEMGASGKLLNWDRTADLPKITVPTLAIGARYDTMEPAADGEDAAAKGRVICTVSAQAAIWPLRSADLHRRPDPVHSRCGRKSLQPSDRRAPQAHRPLPTLLQFYRGSFKGRAKCFTAIRN